MSTSEKAPDTGRRSFLKLASVSAPAAAVAAVAGTEAGAEELAAEAGEGLRKTPHVNAYLDSARF